MNRLVAVSSLRAPVATPGHSVDFALTRRPALTAVFALAVGLFLGPLGVRLLRPQLIEDGPLIESVAEIALLVCLFCLGLRLRMPMEWRIWRLPLRLSTLTTLATIALAAAAAHLIFDMNLAGSLLLGTIVAPTDSLLAPDAAHSDSDQDAPAFVLAAESGINSGLSTVLVLLVVGMMGLIDSESAIFSSVSLVAFWSAAGGFAAGCLIGAAMARWITVLDPERQAEFLEEAVVFATAALAYGAALAIHTDGFLAVFAAGVALSHGGRFRRQLRNRALMPRVLAIAGRMERYAWLLCIVLLGTLVATVEFRPRMFVFAGLLLLLIRPLAVRLGLGGLELPESQWRGVAWFTGRGVASLYCLSLAINHGLSPAYTRQLAGITLVVVVSSIVASAISGLPLSRGASPGTVDL